MPSRRHATALRFCSLAMGCSKVGDVAGGPAPEWSRWHIFWADERVVPLDHADSNYAAALPTFLSQVLCFKA